MSPEPLGSHEDEVGVGEVAGVDAVEEVVVRTAVADVEQCLRCSPGKGQASDLSSSSPVKHAGGAVRSFVSVCCAAGRGTTTRTTRAQPTATGTTRTTGTTTSGFVWCVRPRLSAPSRLGAYGSRAGAHGLRERIERTSGVVRRPRFADRGGEGKMARARPVRTARPRQAVTS